MVLSTSSSKTCFDSPDLKEVESNEIETPVFFVQCKQDRVTGVCFGIPRIDAGNGVGVGH